MIKTNIQDLRKTNNISQKKASEVLGITKEYLSMIERGLRNPSDKLKRKMSLFYKVDISIIFLAIQETKRFTNKEAK